METIAHADIHIVCMCKCKCSLWCVWCTQWEKLGYVSRGGEWVWHVAEETLASATSAGSNVKWQPLPGPQTTHTHTHTSKFHKQYTKHGLPQWGTGPLFGVAPFYYSAVSPYGKRAFHFRLIEVHVPWKKSKMRCFICINRLCCYLALCLCPGRRQFKATSRTPDWCRHKNSLICLQISP